MKILDTPKAVKQFVSSFLMLALLCSCATTSPPLTFLPDAAVKTLSSALSMSVHTADSGMSGNGFLVYRRPDQVHLVVLSPFGTTLMEVFAMGDRITLVYPSKSTAYVGRFDELPDKGSLKGWKMMRWAMDADPADDHLFSGVIERMSKLGGTEKVTFKNGLVTLKISSNGDKVYYDRYSLVNGIPLAAEMDMRNERDDRIRIVLDEPEVNTVIDDAAFKPRLDGLTILPLSAIQGF